MKKEKGQETSNVVDHNAWFCFRREKRTVTELPDGREVLIGGQFSRPGGCPCCHGEVYTFNDVVVLMPNREGILHIWSYPKAEFPPVFDHAAVYIPSLEEIWIIGGRRKEVKEEETLVFALRLQDWSIRKIVTHGPTPRGGLWRVSAVLQSEGVIDVKGQISKSICSGLSRATPNTKTFFLNVVTREWDWKRN